MKKIYKTFYLSSAQREFVQEVLGIPASQLDARRTGVTQAWLREVWQLALQESGR